MKNLQQFVIENNFKEDKQRNAVYGVFKSYPVVVVYDKVRKVFLITVNAKEPEGSDNEKNRDMFSAMAKEVANVNYVSYNEGIVSINLKDNKKTSSEALAEILKKVTSYCQLEGFVHTCKYCENENGLDFYSIQGNVEVICPECYEKIVNATTEKSAKRENIDMGVVGAVLGALIGGAIWVGVYQLGYIVAIAAYLMVVCAVKGYEKLAGSLSKKGLWISIIVSIIVLFLAEYVCIGVEIYKVFDVTIFEAIKAVPSFMELPEIMGAFIKDIVIGYVFMAIASFRYISSINHYVSNSYEVKRLD